jgi:hypothetical protein
MIFAWTCDFTGFLFVEAQGKANLFVNVADIISTVEFDHTGNYLATGDKGGRVVLFERNETVRNSLSAGMGSENMYPKADVI